MIWELLLFGTVWFWMFIGGVFAVMIMEVEGEVLQNDSFGVGATIVLIFSLLLLYFFGNKTYFDSFIIYAIDKPSHVIGMIMGYFVVGTIWSFVKWYFFLLNKRDYFLKNRDTYCVCRQATCDAPKVSDYQYVIIRWMTYWPFSMVWTLINDPVRRIFNRIYCLVQKQMQSLSDRMFAPYAENKSDKVS